MDILPESVLRRCLLLVLWCSALIGFASGACDNGAGLSGYYECIKREVTNDYQNLETEFLQGYRRQVQRCFGTSANDGLCVFSHNDFQKKAFAKDGVLLGGCQICQDMATFIQEAFFSDSVAERKCIRRDFIDAIAQEIRDCVRQKTGAEVPNFTDWDEAAFGLIPSYLQETSDLFILTSSRQQSCKSRSPSRYQATTSCMRSFPAGYLTRHCSVHSKCMQQNTCQERIYTVRRAACECGKLKEVSTTSRISQIRDAVARSQSTEDCVNRIIALLTSDANVSWIDVLHRSVERCLIQQPLANVKQVIDGHCYRALQPGEEGKKGVAEMIRGFEFIINFVASVVGRTGRFCNCA